MRLAAIVVLYFGMDMRYPVSLGVRQAMIPLHNMSLTTVIHTDHDRMILAVKLRRMTDLFRELILLGSMVSELMFTHGTRKMIQMTDRKMQVLVEVPSRRAI